MAMVEEDLGLLDVVEDLQSLCDLDVHRRY
jgi:hypothetical protein